LPSKVSSLHICFSPDYWSQWQLEAFAISEELSLDKVKMSVNIFQDDRYHLEKANLSCFAEVKWRTGRWLLPKDGGK